MGILDYIFPKRCVGCKTTGSYLCANCFSYISFNEQGTCFICQRSAIGGRTHPRCQGEYMIDGVISSIVYKGIVKRLIYQFKFNPYISDLTTVLVDLFYEGLIQKEEFINLTEEKIIVPVPLHHSKLRKRGYNQAALLAQGLQKKLSSVTIWECLERIKPTHTQVGLSAEQRKENLKNAFAIKKTFQPKLRQLSQIILVDDIITSGATMLETAKMLKQAGVKEVWGITLAHGK